jgi:tRNA (guanosine-2'-O-)-methyltransferase
MSEPPRPRPAGAPDATRRARLTAFVEAHALAGELTPRRTARVIDVLLRRLSSVTVVMENLADPHNASAVLRTAEGLGLDAIHVVEQPNRWEKNAAIAKGADRWIEVVRHQGLARCLGDLSARGFQLFAADVGPGCVPVHDIDVARPVALVFGSERDGLSRRALALTDARFTVPMFGFVESFNVSVSAALALYDVSTRRRAASAALGDLEEHALFDRADLYLRRAVKSPELIRHLEETGALPRRP